MKEHAEEIQYHVEALAKLVGVDGNPDLDLLKQISSRLLSEYQYELVEKESWVVGGDRDLPLLDDETWDADEAVRQIRNWAEDDDGNIDFGKYKRAFIIYDRDNSDNLTAYRFPFCKVVDGRLKASRAALITAKRMALGARTGRRHPLADRIVAFVNGYLGEENEKENVGVSEELISKEQFEALKAELEATRARLEQAEKLAQEERERRLEKEYNDKASAYASVFGVDAGALAKMIRVLDESGVEWAPMFDAIKKKVDEVTLTKELGVSVGSDQVGDFESAVLSALEKYKDADIVALIRQAARDRGAYDMYRERVSKKV